MKQRLPWLRRCTGLIAGAALLALAAGPSPVLADPPVTLTPQGQQGVVEEIEAFRRAIGAAIAAKDVGALRKFYAESFTHTHTTSKVDGRDTRIVSALAGEPVIETAPVESLRITIHAGGWVAVATGVSPILAISDGKTYAVHWTAVYARNQENWQFVASHATRGPEIRK